MKRSTFYTSLLAIALPIVLQHFLRTSLNLVSNVMIGQNGDVAVAAVGLANQIFFLLILMLFGITTGSAIFTAQFWGKQDVPNIRRVLGISVTMSAVGGLAFFLAGLLIPEKIIAILTHDPEVISLGAQYLRIASPSFLFLVVTFAYGAVVRSTGDVRTPLYSSIFGLALTTLFSYLFIFGAAGLPKMGVVGAAYAVNIGRFTESAVLLFLVYRKYSPAAASWREMFDFDLRFLKMVATRSLPVAVNETLWSLGITAYFAIYSRIGTEAVAAVNIAITIEDLAFVIFLGIAEASGIIVGNTIGEGDTEKAYQFGSRAIRLALFGAILMGAVMILSARGLISFYNISPTVSDYAYRVLVASALTMWVRVMNMILIIGILRSGGDTRFSMILDSGTIWGFGVPLAMVGAFVLDWPVYYVYPLALSEEFIKFFVCLYRFRSRKWINDLTRIREGLDPADLALNEG